MIRIIDKHNCCGCSACASACPKACISMQEDEEGFLYPLVDAATCIDCGICEKVCPFLATLEAKRPLHTYAAINPSDSERLHSSSGGIFTMLMRETLKNGGVVFGAAFNEEWNVRHIAIESEEDIPLLQGSKYVQSVIGDSFKSVKVQLQAGRKVLFSGTACQIAGLKRYLKKEYENLLTVDVVCHGVPSPAIWQNYLKSFIEKDIKAINFRDKKSGWVNYDFVIKFIDGTEHREPHDKNVYMQGFLHDLYLRPSCHNCKLKGGRCGSDLTLGDYWHVESVLPSMNDNRGVSVVLVNSNKGEKVINLIISKKIETEIDQAARLNPCIINSTPESKWRNIFWDNYSSDKDFKVIIENISRRLQPKLANRLFAKIKFKAKALLSRILVLA